MAVERNSFFDAIRTHRWFSFFCLFSIVCLVLLGSWQLTRLQWKLKLIEDVTNSQSAPSLKIPAAENIPPYQKVTAKGRWIPNQTILMGAQFYGGKGGYHILTPLKLSNGDIVIVNRGWIPQDKKPLGEQLSQLDSSASVSGIAWYISKKPAWFLPHNNPAKNQWLWPDTKEIIAYYESQFTGKKILPFILRVTGEPLSKSKKAVAIHQYPVPLNADFEIRNDHLQYAITWFLLAIVVAGMFIIYIRRKL